MDDAMKQVEKVILAAAPAYEMYLLQTMGRAYHLKPPLIHINSEKVKVVYDSNEYGDGTRDRLVMYVEFNRAMGSSTVTTEYWNDLKSTEPSARGEAKVDATSENLMAPAFAFGWLHKLVGAYGEALEGEGMDPVEAQMERAEQLILKTDEALKELGYVIESDSYESYANTLDRFLLTGAIEEQTEGVLKKVGNIVRKAASAYGAAKGTAGGLKQRWQDFKASVKTAYSTSHDAAKAKWSGAEPKKSGGDSAGKGGKLKLVKGGKGGKKMSDKEYRARYGKARPMAASAEAPDLDSLVDGLRDEYFEREFLQLNVEELLALERMVVEMHDGKAIDEALAATLAARGGVRNPAALAAWIGRQKYGHDKFQEMSKEGRRKKKLERAPTKEVDSVVSTYQKLSGVALPMQSWSLYKGK